MYFIIEQFFYLISLTYSPDFIYATIFRDIRDNFLVFSVSDRSTT